MSEFGTGNKPIQSDSQSGDQVSSLRSEFQQNINGHIIRADRTSRDHVFVTLDGHPFAGSFIEAIQAATKLPYRWSGVFE